MRLMIIQTRRYIWRDKNGKKYQFYFGNDVQLMDAQDRPLNKKMINYFRTEHPILSKVFNQQEQEILKNPRKVYHYAVGTLQQRWPEAEAVLLREPAIAHWYAVNMFDGRWPEAEPYIKQDANAWDKYTEFLKSKNITLPS